MRFGTMRFGDPKDLWIFLLVLVLGLGAIGAVWLNETLRDDCETRRCPDGSSAVYLPNGGVCLCGTLR